MVSWCPRFRGVMVSGVSWFHRFLRVRGFLGLVSLFHRFRGVIGFVVSWGSWFHGFRGFLGFMVS